MIGKDIKKIRKELDLTQWDLAIKLGVTQSSIVIWEKGYRTAPEDIEKSILKLQSENS